MNSKKNILFIILLFFLFSVDIIASDPAEFTIIYSHDLLGNLEPCG